MLRCYQYIWKIGGRTIAKYSDILMEIYISFFLVAISVLTANEMVLPVYFTNDIERQVFNCLYVFLTRGCLHETRNDIYLKWNFISSWKSFCLYYFSLWAKWDIISFQGRSELKKCKQSELDIKTSMLESTMQAFIEQVLR